MLQLINSDKYLDDFGVIKAYPKSYILARQKDDEDNLYKIIAISDDDMELAEYCIELKKKEPHTFMSPFVSFEGAEIFCSFGGITLVQPDI